MMAAQLFLKITRYENGKRELYMKNRKRIPNKFNFEWNEYSNIKWDISSEDSDSSCESNQNEWSNPVDD